MAFDETLAQRVRDALCGEAKTEELQMFGGLAFTVNGNVCCGVVGDDLMLRVGPERYAAALSRPHAREMDFTGRPLKTMIYVAPQGIRRTPSLKSWLGMALDFVTTLEPKAKAKTRKRTVAAKKTTAKSEKTARKPIAKKSTKKTRAKKPSAATKAATNAKTSPKKSRAATKKGSPTSSVKRASAKRASKPPASKKPSVPPKSAAKAATKRASSRPERKRSPSARPAKKPSITPPKAKSVPPKPPAAGRGTVSIRPKEASARQSVRPRSLLPIGPFVGFPPKTLRYLRELRAHNDKAWFDDHRGHYESFYLKPALEFIAAIGPKLRSISPDIQFEPRINGSLFRIQRDIRFSKDKTPYKPHIDLWFWHGDRKNWSTPGYFFRLEPKKLTVGGGTHRFDVTQLANFRESVVDAERGSELDQTLSTISARQRISVGGATRKAVPRDFDPNHHRAHLLLHEGLYAAYEGPPPASLHDASFVDWCVAEFQAISPLVDWLLRL